MSEKLNTAKTAKSRLFKARKEHARNKRIMKWLFGFFVVAIAFLCGFLFRSQVTLMTKLGVPIGSESALNVVGSTSSSEASATRSLKSTFNSISERISEVEDILAKDSFGSVNIDPATQVAIEAIMKNLDDEYAKYYNSESYAKLVADSKSDTYDGIGVLFSETQGRVVAADVFAGGEADMKGVSKGDYIKSIDGHSSDSWTFSEVVQRINEAYDSSLLITWGKGASSESKATSSEYTVALSVSKTTQENVTYSIEEDDVGYIKIRQFSDSVPSLLTSAVSSLTSSGAKSFVIDVRDNPGGFVTSALDSASLFVASGTLVNIETKDSTTSRTTQGEIITTSPIVVLVNSNTAAAAEVFASAMHDNAVATTVGQTSAGKGIISATRELSFGGAIRYSAARYSTPSGNQIQGNGIRPDIVISNTDDTSVDDNQLSIALQNAKDAK